MIAGADLRAGALAARQWLFDHAFPLWSTAGFDPASGQFVEALDGAGRALVETPRRTLVQARQLYVFSVAAGLGWDGPWRSVMSAAAARLVERGRTADGDWIYAFDGRGQPMDRRADLYTQAFVIFGLTHAAMALDRPDLLAAAVDTRRRLERGWRAPGGGFVEGALYPNLRRQNPHMHLFEAAQALSAVSGDPADDALADALAALFKARFSAPCGLLEFYDGELVPLTDDRGRVCEPGHMFEWAWLVGGWATRRGGQEQALTDHLYACARRGVTAEGLVVDELWSDGAVKTAGGRLWPQAERLKAALRRRDRIGAADALSALKMLDGYLDGAPPGAWRDRRAADGRWVPGPAPASSGYHLVGALDELIRASETSEPVA